MQEKKRAFSILSANYRQLVLVVQALIVLTLQGCGSAPVNSKPTTTPPQEAPCVPSGNSCVEGRRCCRGTEVTHENMANYGCKGDLCDLLGTSCMCVE